MHLVDFIWWWSFDLLTPDLSQTMNNANTNKHFTYYTSVNSMVFSIRFLELWFPQLFIWFAVHMCIFHLRWFCQLRFAKIYLPCLCHMQYIFDLSIMQYALAVYPYYDIPICSILSFIFCSIYNIPPDAGPITVRTRGCVWSQSRRIRGITSSLWLPGADQSEAFTTRH